MPSTVYCPVLSIIQDDSADYHELLTCGIAYSQADALELVKVQLRLHFEEYDADSVADDLQRINNCKTQDELGSVLGCCSRVDDIRNSIGYDHGINFEFSLNPQKLPRLYVCSIAYNDINNHNHLHTSFKPFASVEDAFKHVCKFIANHDSSLNIDQSTIDEETLREVIAKAEETTGLWFTWNIIPMVVPPDAAQAGASLVDKKRKLFHL